MKKFDLNKKAADSRTVTQEKTKDKRITGYVASIITAVIIMLLLICLLILPAYKKAIVQSILYDDIALGGEEITATSETVENTYNEASLKKDISEYVANYFNETNVRDYLSDDNVEQLADIIINSLTQAGIVSTDSSSIRESVISELKTLMEVNNITTEQKLESLKETILLQLEEDGRLTEEDKQKILDMIAALDRDSETDLESLKTEILKELQSKTDISTTEIEKIKTEIEKIIIGTSADLSDFKDYLDNEVIPSLNITISKNQTEIQNNSTSILNLANDMTTAKNDITSIQNNLTALFGSLDNCSISYNEDDGHFYITYNAGGADSVTKKLDFAR